MNSKEAEISDLIKKFEGCVKRHLNKFPYPTVAQYEEAVERAFFKKHKEIENEIRQLEQRMIRANQGPSKQVEVSSKLKQNRWQNAISQLEGENGIVYVISLTK